MNVNIYTQNKSSTLVHDITQLVGNIQHETHLRDAAGKLTFIMYDDPTPNSQLTLDVGDIVAFLVDGKGVFYGTVFTIGVDARGTYKVTAYDSLRYFKSKTNMLTEAVTPDEIFRNCCKSLGISRYRIDAPTTHIVKEKVHTNKTFYEIAQYGMDDIARAEFQRAASAPMNSVADLMQNIYFLRDDYGTLVFDKLDNRKTDNVIGTGSLLTSFQYERSIDKNSFNQIEVVQQAEKKSDSSRRKLVTMKDLGQGAELEARWGGVLRDVVIADAKRSDAEMRELGIQVLALRSRETRSMKLSALGIVGLNAGDGFRLDLDEPKLNQDMIILKATHNYSSGFHTMSLDVYAGNIL